MKTARTSVFSPVAFLVVILLALCVLSGCAKTQPMLTPKFETLSSNPAVVSKGIKTALLGRGWSIQSDRPGRVEAAYTKRGQNTARIAVVYSGKTVRIDYLGSANLMEGTDASGTRVIHKTYNNWVTYLEKDIQTEVARHS